MKIKCIDNLQEDFNANVEKALIWEKLGMSVEILSRKIHV